MKNWKLHSVKIEQFPSIQPLRKINFEKKNERLKGNFVLQKNRVGIERHLIAKKNQNQRKVKDDLFCGKNTSLIIDMLHSVEIEQG